MTMAQPNPSYVLGPTAVVTNEEFPDGEDKGFLTVQARRGESESNRTPYLQGTLYLADGSTAECSMRRAYIWNNFTDFMDLDLVCESEVEVGKAERLVLS